MDIIYEAKVFAIAAHEAVGQKRKYTGAPYWYHCGEVAQLVAQYTTDHNALCAAWLHDVVEDTQITLDTINFIFGGDVHSLLYYLTDKSRPTDGNREKRKEIDRKHIMKGGPLVHTIKCADLISNTYSIVEHDKDFAKIYLKEKELLLEVLTEAEPLILEKAYEVLREAQRELYLPKE